METETRKERAKIIVNKKDGCDYFLWTLNGFLGIGVFHYVFFRRKPTLPHTTIAIYLRTKTKSIFAETILRPFVINYRFVRIEKRVQILNCITFRDTIMNFDFLMAKCLLIIYNNIEIQRYYNWNIWHLFTNLFQL